MSLLANNTLASPGLSFYALAGGGADTLQSPVSLIPEANGNQSLEIVASTGSGEADLLVSSTNGNDATITINSTAGGDATIALGQGLVPGGSGYAIITAPGAVMGGGQIQIENGSGANGSVATFDTNNNQVYLGQTTVAGLTTVRNGLLVNDQFVVNDPSIGIGLTVTSPATGVIAMSSSTGTLNLGSSSSNPDIIRLTDGGAADTGGCTIGQNGGLNLSLNGGTVANPGGIGANLRTDAASTGVLTIGSSVSNPTTLFVKDTGAAGTGFVDVAGGVFNSIALRLQGANAQVGSNAAQVSTNNTAVNNPILNISNSVDGTPKMVINSTGTTFNGTNTITGDTTFTTGNCVVQGILGFNFTGGSGAQCGAIEGMNSYTSATVSCGDNSTATIPNPTDSLGGAIEAGLYFILGRNSTANNVPWQSVSTIGYWTGSAWVGGGGCCPALVSAPPSFLGIQGGGATLILANGSGLGAASMIFYFRQIGGLLGMS